MQLRCIRDMNSPFLLLNYCRDGTYYTVGSHYVKTL